VALAPETVNDEGLKDMPGPEGDTVPVSVIVPENPLRLLRVIVVVPVDPEAMFTELGLGLMLKSGTLIVTETVAE
jgi:hypothetical protein